MSLFILILYAMHSAGWTGTLLRKFYTWFKKIGIHRTQNGNVNTNLGYCHVLRHSRMLHNILEGRKKNKEKKTDTDSRRLDRKYED